MDTKVHGLQTGTNVVDKRKIKHTTCIFLNIFVKDCSRVVSISSGGYRQLRGEWVNNQSFLLLREMLQFSQPDMW